MNTYTIRYTRAEVKAGTSEPTGKVMVFRATVEADSLPEAVAAFTEDYAEYPDMEVIAVEKLPDANTPPHLRGRASY